MRDFRTMLRVALLLAPIAVAQGCAFFAPYPLPENLPAADMRKIKVLDAATGAPVDDAVVRCVIFPEVRRVEYSEFSTGSAVIQNRKWSDSGQKVWYIPNSSDPAKSATATTMGQKTGDGLYEVKPELLLGWGSLVFIWYGVGGESGFVNFAHKAPILVEAQGYLPMMVMGPDYQCPCGESGKDCCKPPAGAKVEQKDGVTEVWLAKKP